MEDEIRFGPYTLCPGRRALLKDGVAQPLGSRALDVLVCLVSAAGEIRSHQEIVSQVWPDTHVEEANLRVHISTLRKVLGDNSTTPSFIANVPGRGYSFIWPLDRPTPDLKPAAGDRDQIPEPARIFGRAESIDAVVSQIGKGRLVTVTGPGGIGKSTVAREAARGLGPGCRTMWIDLSEVASGARVPTVVATAFGVVSRANDLSDPLLRAMEDTPTVVILDSCEHVIDGVTEFVETALARTARLRFLATSREPLRALGERVHRLQPLDAPTGAVTAQDAAGYPAVQLFVERADATLGGYELTDDDAPMVVGICQRLDGIALAIELAAGRLETMGVAALANSLTDSFRVLSRGRRTALARHQTLQATLDWSYLLLDPAEQRALRELSVFRGRFAASAAQSVLNGDGFDQLAGLIAKSLVVLDTGAADPFYRLLDTTRLYAFDKLVEAGELSGAMDRLGTYLLDLLEAAGPRLQDDSAETVAEEFSYLVASLRAYLDWAVSPGGDMLTGASLTVAALPLYFKLSLFDECAAVVTASLRFLEQNPDLDETLRMKLYAAIGWPQLAGADVPERGVTAWNASARIAERLGDLDHQLRAIWALWADAINRGEPIQGLALAQRFLSLATTSGDPGDTLVGRRMEAATLHWLGRHAEAAAGLEAVLQDYDVLPARGHEVRFQFDQTVTALMILARCQWFLGDADRALATVEVCLEHAQGARHLASVSNALAVAACPIALMSGNHTLAAQYIAQLREHTRMVSLDVWHTYADCFEAELIHRQGDHAGSLRQLRAGLEPLHRAGFVQFEPMFRTTEARALSALGRHTDALAVLEEPTAKAVRSGELWWLPELYREKAALCLALSDAAGAALCLDRALETALSTGSRSLIARIQRDRVEAGQQSGLQDGVA